MSYNSKYKGAEVEELLDSIGDKVDKVDGKQLSTEDFTTLLKQKLEGLSNYDDTDIQFAVSQLRGDLDSLVSGDTTTAIKTFDEIIAFLDGIEDSQSLDSIIASIEQQIAGKQNTITDLTTIREGAAKGATALQEVPSGYAKTEDIPTKVSELENDKEYYTPIHSGTKTFEIHIPQEGWMHVSSDLSLNEELFDSTPFAYQNNIVVNKYGGMTNLGGWSGSYRKQKINGATSQKAGFMTASDKAKLDGIDITKKQDTLVSGTNIKTINGESILGEGDITIEGGSDVTVPTKLSELENDLGFVGKESTGYSFDDAVGVKGSVSARDGFVGTFRGNGSGQLDIDDNGNITTRNSNDDRALEITTSGNGTKFLSNDGTYKTISGGGSTSGSSAYPLVEHGTGDTTFTLTPNTFHVWDEVASLDLSLGAETSGVANEYLFQFTSGSTATTLTLPSDIKWANDTAPTIAADMIYQVSILKGLACVLEFSNAVVLIENKATVTNIDMGEVQFQYPVASTIVVNVRSDMNYKLIFNEGDQTKSVNEPSIDGYIITSINPIKDSVYNYTF